MEILLTNPDVLNKVIRKIESRNSILNQEFITYCIPSLKHDLEKGEKRILLIEYLVQEGKFGVVLSWKNPEEIIKDVDFINEE